MKVTDYIINFFELKGIKHIFTISGGGCMHLIDSLGKSKKISYICNHHEQATAMAMEGYSRMNEHLGVGIVTTGPGGTNMITGVMGSWLDSIPVFVVSGQVQTTQLSDGTGCRQIGDQEFNIVDTVKNMTKYSKRVDNPDDIPYEMQKAYSLATTGRPGPVWIDVPLDVQAKQINFNNVKDYFDHPIREEPHLLQMNKLIEKLRRSKKPLLVLGGGIRLSPGAKQLLYQLLDRFKIPVVTGPHSSVDIINESYDSYCGRIGVLGQRSSNKIVQECDFLISVGSRLNVKMTGYKYQSFAKGAYKVIVDVDANEMNKFNIVADLKIHSDSAEFLKKLIYLTQDDSLQIEQWRKYCKEIRSNEQYVFEKHRNYKGFASNYCFVEGLSNLVPEQVPTVTSNGSAHVVTLQTMRLKGNQRLFTNVGCASMGYGLPASIGACIANNRKKTICIEGDGSLQMNIQELQTIVHHKLPIIIFVINNGVYLSIKRTQEAYFNSNYVGTNESSGVTCPDLSKISYAYGIKYVSIRDNEEIELKISECLECDGPVVCEVYTNPNEKHEPKVTAVMNPDGTFSPGELTDMKIEGVTDE
jgi:acetolactate synthase I/II/III large subunit